MKYKYNKDGTVKSRRTTVISYWDAVMAVGGPTLIFLVYNIIKRIGTIADDMFTETEQEFIKEHPLVFIAMGPVGMKMLFKKADFAERLLEIEQTYGPKFWIGQIMQNWGLNKDVSGYQGNLPVRDVTTEGGKTTVRLGWNIG